MNRKKPKTANERGYPITRYPDRDRRVRQNARVARVLRVLNLIQSRGRWTAKAIAEELECSERTVYRDLEVLEFSGVPYFRDEVDHTIRVRSDFRFPVLTLSDEEVIGQAVATAITATPGLNVTAGAAPTTQKLLASSNERIRQVFEEASKLVSVLDLKLADHSRHHEMIKTIQAALLQRKQITGHYESPYESRSAKLRLHPYRLCLVKNAWYLIGQANEEPTPRTYRVARFKTLRMLDSGAVVPNDFDLRSYFGNAWAVYRGSETYDVEVVFTPEAARIVTETTWHHTQTTKFEKDGSVTFSFQVDGLEEIANWLLSWTGRVKVVQPIKLREMIVDRLNKALEMNGE